MIFDYDIDSLDPARLVELRPLPPIERDTERWELITKATESVRRACFVCGEYVDDGAVSVLIGGIHRPHHKRCWERSKANVRMVVSQ